MNALAPREPAPATPDVTAIVAAMGQELSPLVQRTRVARRMNLDGCRVWIGRLASTSVVLARTGEGRRRAEQGVRSLLDRFPVSRLLVLGVAGGLSPALATGDLLVARRVLRGPRPVPPPDAAWVERALRLGGAQAGTAVTSERILCTATAKSQAWNEAGAAEPATVDLESAVYAEVAAERGIPYLVLCAVSDPADEAFPLDLNQCLDAAGGVSRVRVIRRALMHPASVRELWHLRRKVGLCARRMAQFTEALLRSHEGRS